MAAGAAGIGYIPQPMQNSCSLTAVLETSHGTTHKLQLQRYPRAQDMDFITSSLAPPVSSFRCTSQKIRQPRETIEQPRHMNLPSPAAYGLSGSSCAKAWSVGSSGLPSSPACITAASSAPPAWQGIQTGGRACLVEHLWRLSVCQWAWAGLALTRKPCRSIPAVRHGLASMHGLRHQQ